MIDIEFKFTGDVLAKVLYFYGLADHDDVSSGEFKIVCPFHGDVNPSMQINLNDGTFYCYGCLRKGNALDFVKEVYKLKNRGIDDLKACIVIMKIIKSKKCNKLKIKPGNRQRKDNKTSLLEASDYYYGLSKIDWDKRYNKVIGEEVESLGKYMGDRGFKTSTLTKIGAKITFNKSYGIIFPIMDNKTFKGWVCRTSLKNVEKKRKYLYNKGFSRATTLCGIYGKKDYVYVVEGFMDMLKMRQNGIHNVVALFGWKATPEQITKLKLAGVKVIISALDNDQYGRMGTQFLKSFFDVYRFKYLKGFKDPGEMNKEQFTKMNNKTWESINLMR